MNYMNIPKTTSMAINIPQRKSNSPKTCSLKKVVLKGGPYSNKKSMSELITLCVPTLDAERAKMMIDIADEKGSVTLTICDRNSAETYYRNLIENGLEAYLE